MNTYDDNKYGVITRKWFGLSKKLGGDAAAGYTLAGTGDAGPDTTHLTRFYPKGPVNIIKFGVFNLATQSQGASAVDKCLARLKGRGASASNMASVNLVQTAPFAIASIESSNTTDFPITRVNAGEYISIVQATKETANGTDLGSTLAGTVAFFVDIVPAFDADKWDADKKKYQA